MIIMSAPLERKNPRFIVSMLEYTFYSFFFTIRLVITLPLQWHCNSKSNLQLDLELESEYLDYITASTS